MSQIQLYVNRWIIEREILRTAKWQWIETYLYFGVTSLLEHVVCIHYLWLVLERSRPKLQLLHNSTPYCNWSLSTGVLK